MQTLTAESIYHSMVQYNDQTLEDLKRVLNKACECIKLQPRDKTATAYMIAARIRIKDLTK